METALLSDGTWKNDEWSLFGDPKVRAAYTID